MSRFDHSICDGCWAKLNPEGRIPHRIKEEFRETKVCCFCGMSNFSGIQVARDFDVMFMKPICKGDHEE